MLDFNSGFGPNQIMKKPDLQTAYNLHSPDDNARLYADWAETYDAGFAAHMTYRLPQLVADAFIGAGPVLDVGAGTGLLGQALHEKGIGPIDGIDISPQMLAVACGKGVYRDLMIADLTQPLTLSLEGYKSVVSSGTFTHGHVGPSPLAALIDAAAPDTQFVITINAQVFKTAGFDTLLAHRAAKISQLTLHPERIYGDAPDPDHRDDTALIVRFSKI
jgi:SAM-dependent methyltransferase